jgi:excisionase family DNA binding protein
MNTKLAVGSAPMVVSVPNRDVTVAYAAKVLNMSRPTVVRLVNDGVLPSKMVGSRRRIPLAQLLVFNDEAVAARRAALDAMAADAEALGFFD